MLTTRMTISRLFYYNTQKGRPVYAQLSTEPVSLTECPIRNIKMKQKQEGACAVPDCKGIPSFGPILMPNDLTFKEAYLCRAHKELLVREVIETVIAKNVPFEILNN